MALNKPSHEKTRLHFKNKNRERYDLAALIAAVPDLKAFVSPNRSGEDSIDFSNPKAVKLLNKALLFHYYGIQFWDFPDENLTPPIPGRADYIHYMAELLGENNFGRIPTGHKITCYDVGVGASCIYPIVGVIEYGWQFIGSDINPKSVEIAQQIVAENPLLDGKVTCVLQKNPKDIFYGVINKVDKIDLMICNPPFHASAEEAQIGTRRKIKNLSGKSEETPELNFAGNQSELICEGGEIHFIQHIIRESGKYAQSCFWFSTLVSKASNLKTVYKSLEKLQPTQIKTIPMGTGNKSTRIVAWTFLTPEQHKDWITTRWKVNP
jgi:23S rRNA (adenine1618-N6)-methyltransferase